MWSKLTEYAAEIVAPPSDEGDRGSEAHVGDEIWSRFANIVAPPGGETAREELEKNEEEEEDQERYISELERALLQKKKQNDVLEQRIRELEANGTAKGEDRDDGTGAASSEKDERIARLENELETLKRTAEAESQAKELAKVEETTALQKRISELEVQCGVLEATLRENERATAVHNTEHGESEIEADRTAPRSSPSVFPTLVQAALTLSKAIPSASYEVGSTDAAIAAQLLQLAHLTRQRIDHSEAQLAKVHAALASFFTTQHVEIAGEGDAFYTDVQSKLGLISHRLAKGERDAREIESVQQQLKTLNEREEKLQKSISALQTQLSGVQASKLKKDASVATRESEIMAEVERRDKVISKLEASEDQLKHTLEQLGKELEDAHAEADELERVCQAQQQELKKLQRRSEQASELEKANEELERRVRELETSAQEYEQGYLELLHEAETVKKQNEEEKAQLVATTEAQVISSEQQMLYELQARLSACEADKLVAVQDADRLQSELDALDKVLLQFRADHKQQRERLLQLEQEVEDARRSSPAKPGSSHSSGSISEEDFRRVMDVLSKRTQECDQLREALENVAKRFSSETVLDKQLAAELVVSYLESDKKHEVIQLMSRMMGFSEQQKQRAGIFGDGHVVIPGNGGGGLFSSIFGGQSATAQNGGTEDKNIDELWTNFLIDEAKR